MDNILIGLSQQKRLVPAVFVWLYIGTGIYFCLLHTKFVV